MKKINIFLKKILSTMLCVGILLSSGTAGITTPKAISGKEINDILDVILNLKLDDSGQMAQNGLDSAVTVLEHLKEFEKAERLAESMPTWSKVVESAYSVIGKVGMTFTMVNGAINFMRTIGIIEDPTQSALMSIQSTVDNIRSTVQDINRRTIDLQSTISRQFAEMQLEFNNAEFTSNQLLWTTFYDDVIAPMQQYENNYSGNVTGLFIDYAEEWQDNGNMALRTLYNKDNEQIYSSNNIKGIGNALPVQPEQSNDDVPVEYAITLPGSYIYNGINRTVYINADNYLTILRSSIENGVYDAAENGDLTAYSGFYDEWNSLDSGEKTKKAKRIADDLIDALAFEVSYEAVNSGNFATDVQSKFTQYCKYIRQEDNLVSPFMGQLRMLALTHGFEGQIKDEAAYLYTYFCNLTIDFGTFASMVMSLAKNKTVQECQDTSDMWWLSQKAIYNDLHSFITGSSNYCYLINKAIEYRDVEIKSDMTTQVGFRLKENEYSQLTEVEDRSYTTYYETYSSTDWKLVDLSKQYSSDSSEYSQQVAQYSNELKNSMISSDEAMLIYCMYKSELSGGTFSGSFRNYLVANNVAVDGKYTSDVWGNSFNGYNNDLLTSVGQSQVFSLSDGEYMNEVYTNPYCKYFSSPSEINVNVGNDSDIEDEYFHIHDRMKGDIFNLSTGTVAENITVASRAFYGEHHFIWRMDEYAFMGRADEITVGDEKLGKKHEDNYMDHKLTATVHRYMSAIVSVPAGTYTIPANVKTINADMFKNGAMFKSLTFNGTPESINSSAFTGVGTSERRCYLNYPSSWGSISLADTWKGGYFADTTVILKSQIAGIDDISCPAAIGEPCRDIRCPYDERAFPEHKVFAGWSLTPNGHAIEADFPSVTAGMTLYAVWECDHNYIYNGAAEANCTQDGYTGGISCTICGNVKTKGKVLPRLGHSYVLNEDTGKSVCSHCGKVCTMESVRYGDLIVTGESLNSAVNYDGDSITVISDTPLIFKNRYEDSTATTAIFVADGVNADITLAGVNIDRSSSYYNCMAIGIDDYSGSTVCITLADGTENTLVAGKDCAALQASGYKGTLKIYGSGSLTATGGENGAGIGGGDYLSVKDIVILGGHITANAGHNAAGIGGGSNGAVRNISVIGGMVTASSDIVAGICGGYDPSNNMTVPCHLTIYSGASVKFNNANELDYITINENGEYVFLNVIDNPNGGTVYIDGDIFPYKEHNGEKKVYVYLPDDEHNIEIEVPENLLVSCGEAVIDYQNNLIFGIDEGQTEIDSYIEPAQGYSMSVTKSSTFCGTNTVVEVLLNGETVESYTVVICGDINGDSRCNGMDSVIISCLVDGMLTESDITPAQYAAADCYSDDIVSDADIEFSALAGIGL